MRSSAVIATPPAIPPMLGTRILTAVILVPLVLAALFMLPPLGWGAISLLVIVVAAAEWANLAGLRKAMWTSFVAGTLLIGGALLLAPSSGFARGWPDAIVLAACGTATLFWLFVATPWLARRWKPESRLALAIAGWVVLIGAWVAVVELQAHSPWLVLAAMAIVWIADTAAYFAGRAFGRHKLAPQVSPGKTWEGVYGALAAVAVYALVLVPLAKAGGYSGADSPIAVVVWVVFALGLVALSIVGDLYESLLKRHAGVKDSGRLLPGHGGVLDRLDAMLAAMPAAALLALAYLR
jgi:phosphatidate cytidylyltransferase